MIELKNIDCMEYMATLEDNAFDLAIVDPPYGINVAKMAYTQEDNRPVKQKNGNILRVKKLKYKHGDWDKEPPPREYFDELRRVTKHQIIFGVEYVNWEGLGEGRIKWNKGVAAGMSFKKYEMAYCSLIDHTEELNLLWAGMCQAKSLSEPMTQQGNKKLNEKRIHPCHKPILLYKKLLLDYALHGYKILDTHGGSGSIACAVYDINTSLKMDIDLVICEIDKEYHNDSVNKFNNHKAQTKLF